MKATDISAAEILRTVRRVARDKFAWPGGYALAVLMDDGGLVCPDCARKEYRQISRDTRAGLNTGWRAVGHACADCFMDVTACDHCGRILNGEEA